MILEYRSVHREQRHCIQARQAGFDKHAALDKNIRVRTQKGGLEGIDDDEYKLCDLANK